MKFTLSTQILEILPFFIVAVTKETNVVYANRAFSSFIDKSDKNILGMRGGDLMNCIHRHDHPNGCGFGKTCTSSCEFRLAIKKCMEKGDYIDEEICFMQEDSLEQLYLRARIIPTINDAETIYTICLENISDKKKLDKTIIEKTKMDGVLLTAGAICHEINNPLAIAVAIMENLLISKSQTSSSSLRKDLKILEEQLNRIASATNKLRNITVVEEINYCGKTKILDLNKSSNAKDN